MFNFIRTRTAGVLAVASGAAIVGLAPGIASAASSAPAGTAAVSHSQNAVTAAVKPHKGFDFRESGVRIYNGANTRTAKVVGLGYPGQGFTPKPTGLAGTPVTCDNGATTTVYMHGADLASHVIGFVPLCNLTWHN